MSNIGRGYDINQTFVIEPAGDSIPIISACTSVYSNELLSCSGNTNIILGTGIISFDGNLYTNDELTASTINASTFYSGGTNLINIIELSSITGGTFNSNTDTLTLYKNSGNVNITGFTDYYTTGATLIGDTVYFDRNDLLSAYTVNLSSLVVNDIYVTGVTFSNNNLLIVRNDGVRLNTFINTFTGLTINGLLQANTISATTISASTFYGDGSNLTGISTQDTSITGGSYNQSTGTASFTNNTGGTFTVSGFTTPFTGGTINSLTATTISATTYQGLPTDIRVTGGTYSNNTGQTTFTNNTGGTFSVSGYFKTSDDIFVSGLTFNNGNYDLILSRNDGNSFTANLGVLASDVTITGGTYNPNTGVATFTNNSGGTFTVSGFLTGHTDTYVSAMTFTDNVLTLRQTQGNATVTQLIDNLSGLTVTGTIRTNSISATTYQNLPIDVFVTGGTYSSASSTITFINNTGGTFNVTGITTTGNSSSTSGNYLPLSGGTVSGNTIFTSGLTASTLNITNYIDFNTGTTNPSGVGGRTFYDNTSKALSYYDVIGNNVPIAMGQQLYTRVYNATGSQIDKGKVIAITGTSNGLPSAILAVNTHVITSARPIGLAAENIANGSEGLVLNNGILSGITINTFSNGDTLYLSDTIPGNYVSTTSSLAFTARTNEIGYVLQTGSTTGKIYVNINNEDSNLSLTDKERNILDGNVISGGVYEYTGITQGTGATINVAPAKGWIVKNTYEFSTLPDVKNVYYTGGTNIPITNLASADATFILINSASTLVQQTTFPTAQERREKIFLGKVVHPNRTSITSINQTVDFDVSPMAAIRDIWTPIKLINQGITVSPHSTTLEINTSAGVLWGNGIGWTTNQQNPDSVSISGTSPTTFQYRTQIGPLTGGTVPTGNTTTIAPGYYDLNGVVTAVGGGTNSSTNQRVFLFPTGLVRIQLGQQVYGNLAAAVAGSQTEQFTEYSLNRENGILIGIISVNKNATNLSLAAQAVFNLVSKFGEVLGGTGGLSTTTLQQAYDNSATPEIVTNSTEGPLSIKNGTGNADNITNILESQNAAGNTTSFIRADGSFSGSSLSSVTITTPSFFANPNGITTTSVSATTYQNLPISGLTAGANIGITGSNSNYTILFTGTTGSGTFTGGTVSGPTTFTAGLSANTISATTYQNLPTDIRVTGASYSNNIFTFTNNTGGTFNTSFNTLTGLTVNGNITITGTSNLNGSIVSTSLTGTTDRLVEVSSGGTVSASRQIISAYLTSGGTVANLLENTANWDIDGIYTGTTITGTYQGQKHYNNNYFFEAVADNLFIRLIRG